MTTPVMQHVFEILRYTHKNDIYVHQRTFEHTNEHCLLNVGTAVQKIILLLSKENHTTAPFTRDKIYKELYWHNTTRYACRHRIHL